MTIIITGGHPTPAFALIEYIQKHRPDVKIIFVGRQITRTSDQQKSPEQTMAKQYGVTFVALNAPKFKLGFELINLWRFLLLLASTWRSWLIINRVRPDAIVSFGSYLAVPVALAGFLSGIKVITHEQTRGLGRANQMIAHLAQTLALSHHNPNLTRSNTVVVGNLLRQSLFTPQSQPPSWLKPNPQLPVLYITGGEQGSEIINATVAQIIPNLVRQFVVIHQCGPASVTRNYSQELNQIKATLSPTLAHRYIIREWLAVQELGYLYQHGALVLSRSGANTVDELAAFHLPSVLIPLPFAQGQEQLHNALSLSDKGAAILLEQKDLTPGNLLSALTQLKNQATQMRTRFQDQPDHAKSADRLWHLIETNVKN